MHLSRFSKHEYTCIDVWVLQDKLQVDESISNIDFFFYFQVNIDLEYAYVLSDYTYLLNFLCQFFEYSIIPTQ
jgi:hypothetical protein